MMMSLIWFPYAEQEADTGGKIVAIVLSGDRCSHELMLL